MATITNLNSGDNGSVSRSTINTNFTNLNADKIEADDSKTLSNKTIDASNNTIQNLGVNNFAAASKTGSDTRVVTGTAGATDNLSKWNADDDLVDTGVAVSTDNTLGGGSAADTKIPTEKAVKDYVDAIGTGTSVQIAPKTGSGATTTTIGKMGQVVYLNSDNDKATWDFQVPSTATSGIVSAKVLLVHNHGTDTIYGFTAASDVAADGQLYDNASDSDTYTTDTLSNKEVEILDVTTAVSAAAAGDLVGLELQITSSTSATFACGVSKLILTF